MEDEETRLRARIEVLEAALRQSISSWRGRGQLIEQLSAAHSAVMAQTLRIDTLESALREIKDCLLSPDQSSAIARAALDRSRTHE